jgi:hypothetical protein
MNRTFKWVRDPRSPVLALALLNFVHVWLLAAHSCCAGVVSPWYVPWSYYNEPTLLPTAAVLLRMNRIWTNSVSCILSGYLVGYFVWLFVTYPAGPLVALHYERLVLKHQSFIESWDCQYLFASIVLCFSFSYLARGIHHRYVLGHASSDESNNSDGATGLLIDKLPIA